MANDPRTPALWVAGFRAQLPDGADLVPGVTVVDVPADVLGISNQRVSQIIAAG